MRLFGTAVLAVVALAASQSAAQTFEQSAIQFSRAKPQESLRGRIIRRKAKAEKSPGSAKADKVVSSKAAKSSNITSAKPAENGEIIATTPESTEEGSVPPNSDSTEAATAPTDTDSTASTTAPIDTESTEAAAAPTDTESTVAATAPADTESTSAATAPPQPAEEATTAPTLQVEEKIETLTLELVFTGDGDPPSPLLECQGDCDDDSQCEGTLQCFQRAGDEPVPGCSGEAKTGSDYCALRPTETTVWLKGDNSAPPENFPLGLCEGDCDNDNHCQDGLVCQQRNGDEPIPGCIGNPVKDIDYCRYPDP